MLKMQAFLPYGERAARALIESGWRCGIDITPVSQERLSFVGFPERVDGQFQSIVVGRAAVFSRKLVDQLQSPAASMMAMQIAKVFYARSAVRYLEADVDIVLGMPGASLEIFKKCANSLRVFHAVDAHPQAHNSLLFATNPDRRLARAEQYPTWLVNRIKREIDLADVVLVPSQLVANQMYEHGIEEQRVCIEPYGVDFSRFRPASDSIACRDKSTARLLYVGQVSTRKGIGQLVDACRLGGVSLRIVGTPFQRKLLRNLPSNVQHIPKMNHQALSTLMGSCDALVLPTHEDACSLVAMEAAAAGLPVITTDRNGAVEILPNASTVIVNAGDVEGLRETLLAVKRMTPEQRQANLDLVHSERKVRAWDAYASDVFCTLSQARASQ